MKIALAAMIHEGVNRHEAAARAGLTSDAVYRALRQKPTLDWYNAELAALRDAERPRNLHTAVAIRDDDGLEGAAGAVARLKAASFLEGRPEGPGIQVNVGVGVQAQQPGYVLSVDPRHLEGWPPREQDDGDNSTTTIDHRRDEA